MSIDEKLATLRAAIAVLDEHIDTADDDVAAAWNRAVCAASETLTTIAANIEADAETDPC